MTVEATQVSEAGTHVSMDALENTPSSTPSQEQPTGAPQQEAVTPPAEAPAQPLVAPVADKPTVLDTEDNGDGTISYQETGDPALDVALGFLGNLGIAGTDPAMEAAATGNFALLEAKLATMGDKAAGWQQMVNLAKDAQSRSAGKLNELNQKINQAVLAVAGDAENWKKVQAWARANADPGEAEEINRMIDSGPVGARAAAQLLMDAYTKANGTVVEPRSATKDAAGATPTTGKLSAQDYFVKVQELRNRLGYHMETSEEYAALRRRLSA